MLLGAADQSVDVGPKGLPARPLGRGEPGQGGGVANASEVIVRPPVAEGLHDEEAPFWGPRLDLLRPRGQLGPEPGEGLMP